MSLQKTFVCFANSRKCSGRCIAGKEWDRRNFGAWFRPVSTREKGVLNSERYCTDWRDPRLLDVLQVSVLKPHPSAYQTENYLLDPSVRWQHVGHLYPKDVARAVDFVCGPLWANGESSRYGHNDKVSMDSATRLSSSLMLVQPDSLLMTSAIEHADSPLARRRVRALFSLAGHDYLLPVTDLDIEKQFKLNPNGFEINMKNPILCISLSERFAAQDACYKLVAAVIAV
jgi:putative nucleic acid modification protein with dual OB domain